MKQIFLSLFLLIGIGIVGCKTVPTEEQVSTFSTLIGATTGEAVLIAKPEPKVQNEIRMVVLVTETVIPTKDQTFVDAWMPVITNVVDMAISEGKLDADARELVIAGGKTVSLGIDFLFAKHPEWRANENLVKAGVHGFCGGFLAVVPEVPVDDTMKLSSSKKCGKKVVIDQECLDYLLKQGK